MEFREGAKPMTQPQFARWPFDYAQDALLTQNLTDYQVRMAAILYAFTGHESAARFVAKMQDLQTIHKVPGREKGTTDDGSTQTQKSRHA